MVEFPAARAQAHGTTIVESEMLRTLQTPDFDFNLFLHRVSLIPVKQSEGHVTPKILRLPL